jgi:DNA-binding GntR family transcriptional regulator
MKEIKSQKPLSELVYDAVVDAICEGSLRPGERLTQEELAEKLNVSRLPVGQALQRLKSEGFVTEAGRRGLKVAGLDPVSVRTIYEFRAGVDQITAGLAARRAGTRQRAEGEAILRRGREAASAGDVRALIGADMRFHWFIYELAGNGLVTDVMTTQWNHIRRIMHSILGEHRNQDQVWREHEAILEAIWAGDASRAERLAREHVEKACDWLLQAIAEERLPVAALADETG